ncbi:hypothetical protein GIB67_013495, partial [Kingdonia uniflora]
IIWSSGAQQTPLSLGSTFEEQKKRGVKKSCLGCDGDGNGGGEGVIMGRFVMVLIERM